MCLISCHSTFYPSAVFRAVSDIMHYFCTVFTHSVRFAGSECYEGSGGDYSGSAHTTESGYECQKWTASTPHQHRYSPATFPQLGTTVSVIQYEQKLKLYCVHCRYGDTCVYVQFMVQQTFSSWSMSDCVIATLLLIACCQVITITVVTLATKGRHPGATPPTPMSSRRPVIFPSVVS